MLAELDNLLGYGAMTLGNHEFDKGCAELAAYVGALDCPVLAANLDAQPGCPLYGLSVRPYVIHHVRGIKVGIVGLANPDVVTLAAACPQTRFTGSAEALKKAVHELQKRDVRHIVLISHLGLPADRELARNVNGVDVIVGGHTHSYLGPGSDEGPYPVVEHAPSGQPVLVVTAKFTAEYLGDLRVTFDALGVPLRWEGKARRLERSIIPDPAVESRLVGYAKPLEAFRTRILGRNALEFADGMEVCRKGDCLSGMVVADAMLDYGRPHGAVMALTNGGGLRAPLRYGDLTQGDLLSVLPFGNRLVIREYNGDRLLAALEHGVSGEQGVGPHLLQVSGLRYSFDAARPVGQRLLAAELIDGNGVARPLKKGSRYKVVLPDYIAEAGDGYSMFITGTAVSSPDPLDVDVVGAYIAARSPLRVLRSGRINRVK